MIDMINKLRNFILVFFAFLTFLGFKAAAQDTQVTAKLDRTTIRIGDQVKLHLTVSQQKKEQVVFPVLADTLSSKMQVVSSSKTDTIIDKNDQNSITVTRSYLITSFDAGQYKIAPFKFIKGNDTLKTEELLLDVASVKVDTTKSIYDIKQPLAVSYSFMDWLRDNWLYVLITLIIIASIGGLIYYLVQRARNKPVIEVAKPVIPIHTLALNKLNELRDKKLWQRGEVKEYYIELTDVIREYLEKRYAIKTQEKTTDEIFEGLQHADITAEDKNMLFQLLRNADLVKFAKGNPVAFENEQSMLNAVELVSKTQKTERSVNTEGGTEGEHI